MNILYTHLICFLTNMYIGVVDFEADNEHQP